MNKRISFVIAAQLIFIAPLTHAQTYPAKAVRMIVAYPPGGGTDIVGRLMAQKMTETMGQTFIVENRGGATGNIGTEAAAHAAPDGYTILMGNVAPNAINVSLFAKMPYDPVTDFEPVSLVAVTPNILVVHPALPVKTIIAYRNGNPVRSNEVAHVYDGIENDKTPRWSTASARSTSRSRSSRAPTSSRSVDAMKALLPAFREQLPPSITLDVRSDRRSPIRESVRDVKFTLLLTIGLVVAGHLPVPAEPLGHDHPEPGAAGVDRRHVRGDVPARLQPRQPVADGAHAVGRLRRRRRDRDAGEHRPAHGDGQAADAGGARRLEGDRVHDPVDDGRRWPRCSSRCCSWAASSAACCTSSR